ncbi:MAG: DUF1684 domain-containing protein [Candidatus Krumholzibacteriia bacterium]
MRREARALAALLWGLVATLAIGCHRDAPAPGPVTMDAAELERWEIALVEMRIEKNERFSDPAQSPLPDTLLAGFEGLNYYFPVPELRFRLPFATAAAGDTVMLDKNSGERAAYVIRGTVTFRHQGRDHELTVFGPADPEADDVLWVPFLDPTGNDLTHPGGRYLDLERHADGTVELDFNYAYNPLCSYDEGRFDCALPPPANRLPFRVEAGEQRVGPEL